MNYLVKSQQKEVLHLYLIEFAGNHSLLTFDSENWAGP